MRQLIAALAGLLTLGERRRWLALLPLMFVGGALETVATGMVFGLIRIAGEPAYALRVQPLAALFERLPWHGDRAIVLGYGALVALFFVLRSLILVLAAERHARAAADTAAALATRLLDRYLAAPFTVHLRHNPSELAYNVTAGVDLVVGYGLLALVGMATESLVALGLGMFLVIAAPVVTLATGAVLAALLYVTLRVTKRSSRRRALVRFQLEREARKHVDQSLGGLREIKVLRRERLFHDAFVDMQGALTGARVHHATALALPRLAIETIFVCSIVLVVSLVTLRRGHPAADVLPLLGIYAYAGLRLIPSANRILMQLESLRRAQVAIDRLEQDLAAFTPEPPLADDGAGPPSFDDAIRLERVSYGYDGAPRPVLHDVSLVIARGASVGVVGPTGAGKSTLIDLVLGLLDPSSGRITVDGIELPAIRAAWQRRIGYVPQVAFLFDVSIRRNVALGIPDAEVDDARLRRAVSLAQLDDFVAELPDGLDTTVGERGLRLSGGQRQRIAIARALYHEPELLVFDEATAALDNATERDVTRAIEALKGKKTLIIIAHRLSTVRRCDTLVVLREGRLVAEGSYERLLAESPDFRALALAPPA